MGILMGRVRKPVNQNTGPVSNEKLLLLGEFEEVINGIDDLAGLFKSSHNNGVRERRLK